MSSKPNAPDVCEEAAKVAESFISKNKNVFMGIAIVLLAIAVYYTYNYTKQLKEFILNIFSKGSPGDQDNDVNPPLVPKPHTNVTPSQEEEEAEAEAEEEETSE